MVHLEQNHFNHATVGQLDLIMVSVNTVRLHREATHIMNNVLHVVFIHSTSTMKIDFSANPLFPGMSYFKAQLCDCLK
jgi:hypothetical protein